MSALAEQLTLDLFPPAAKPVDIHQRGWVRLPWSCYANGPQQPGDLAPAWVCCQCGGVELTEFTLGLNHGCCLNWIGCRRLDGMARATREHPYVPYAPFDAHWLATRPEEPTDDRR